MWCANNTIYLLQIELVTGWFAVLQSCMSCALRNQQIDEMKHSMRHEYFIGKLTGERQMNDLGFCFAVNWEYAS